MLAAVLTVGCGGASDETARTDDDAATTVAATTNETDTAPVLEPLSKELPTCVPAKARKSVVAFRASDGVPLVGVFVGSGARGVVLAHQLDNDLCAWMAYARRLAHLGYRVLSFNFRGYAPSGGQAAPLAYDADVAGAVRTLRRQGARRTVAVGASMGGTAVLTAAPELGVLLAGAASVSAPAELDQLDARAAVERLSTPTLFLASRYDSDFALAARRLFRAAAVEEKEFQLFPGAAHGIDMLAGAEGEGARGLLERFLARQLGTR